MKNKKSLTPSRVKNQNRDISAKEALIGKLRRDLDESREKCKKLEETLATLSQ